MYKHHAESIKKITKILKVREEVRAILLVGTIAQGFEDERSDVDLLIVTTEEDFKARKERFDLKYYDKKNAVYENGYIDGKYISVGYMQEAAKKGSEPARYAFKDAKILYSEIEDLQNLVREITRYPIEEKGKRINSFCSEMMAWTWYAKEALKDHNQYLLSFAVPNIVLFGGRAVLALNEMLYPYHKWFMKILASAPAKPDELMLHANRLLTNPTKEEMLCFCDLIFDFVGIDKHNLKWTDYFVIHNEMNWLYEETPIADI